MDEHKAPDAPVPTADPEDLGNEDYREVATAREDDSLPSNAGAFAEDDYGNHPPGSTEPDEPFDADRFNVVVGADAPREYTAQDEAVAAASEGDQ